MRLLWRILLGTALSMAPTLAAASAPAASDEEMQEWVTTYYRNPNPARAVAVIAAAGKRGLLRQEAAGPPMSGFLAGVLTKSPAVAPAMIRELAALAPEQQSTMIMGFVYAEMPHKAEIMAELARAMPRQKALVDVFAKGSSPRLLEIPLDDASVLDVLWGNFMATGDEGPVARIISALPWSEVRGNIPRLLVGGSAKWSLTSNAVQHPRVLEICRSQLKAQSAEVKPVLAKVIADAEQELKQTTTRKEPPGK